MLLQLVLLKFTEPMLRLDRYHSLRVVHWRVWQEQLPVLCRQLVRRLLLEHRVWQSRMPNLLGITAEPYFKRENGLKPVRCATERASAFL